MYKNVSVCDVLCSYFIDNCRGTTRKSGLLPEIAITVFFKSCFSLSISSRTVFSFFVLEFANEKEKSRLFFFIYGIKNRLLFLHLESFGCPHTSIRDNSVALKTNMLKLYRRRCGTVVDATSTGD